MHKRPKFGGRGGPRSKSKSKPHDKKLSTSKREDAEAKALQERIQAMAPSHGTTYSPPGGISPLFTDLPLSKYTLSGLSENGYIHPTAIQLATIPHALAGRDILGAAKTGSGKTLAFVVPVLEKLFHGRFTKEDGLGALIVSPTRELAMQIFQVLTTVGKGHYALSVGLVVGGKDFEEEKAVIGRMNILVATPGRLLQHLEQTPDFDLSNVQIVVLDEADRCLDMGFQTEMNDIISQLPPPPQRQTLLFSATQTKSVKDLARLSLQDPEYLAVHETAKHVTPKKLAQHYVVCTLENKLNLLYSFIKTHLKSKVIVFVSTCKEAKFVFELFRRIRPGIPVSALHGRIKQTKRMFVYYEFLKKPAAVLFATDIAARGLDFPNVDWVLQLDCPDDTETYIHRVGRTARFSSEGKALLVLLPSETKMVPLLESAKVPMKQISVNPKHATAATAKVRAEVAADTELKTLAQKAFKSYVKSVALQPNKEVFDVNALPLDAFAESCGLIATPKVKFQQLQRTDAASKRKNQPRGLQKTTKDSDASSDEDAASSESESTDSALSSGDESSDESSDPSEDSDDEAEVLTVKKVDRLDGSDVDEVGTKGPEAEAVKGPSRLESLAKQLKAVKTREVAPAKPLSEIVSSRSTRLAESLKVADTRDKELHKERLREKRREEKAKFKQQAMKYTGYTLGTGNGDDAEGDEVIDESDDDIVQSESESEPALTAAGDKKPIDLESAALSLLRKKQRFA